VEKVVLGEAGVGCVARGSIASSSTACARSSSCVCVCVEVRVGVLGCVVG